MGTRSSAAESLSGLSSPRFASSALDCSTRMGSTMNALLATNAVSSASRDTPTTSRYVNGVIAVTMSGRIQKASRSAAAENATKYTSSRCSASPVMVPAVTATMAKTPTGVRAMTNFVMRTTAAFTTRSGASRRSRSSMPINARPSIELNSTTAGTTALASEWNGLAVK